MLEKIPAGVFKAQCLMVMDEVDKKHLSFIITKRGRPVAKLVPIKTEKEKLFGKLKKVTRVKGNIVESIGEEWDACS